MFTPESRHALLFAQRRAAARHMTTIGVPDLFHGVLADGVWATALLTSAGVDPDAVMEPFVLRRAPRFYEQKNPIEITPEARRALGRAKKLADRYGHAVITTAHILVACLTVSDSEVDAVAWDHNLNSAELATQLESQFGNKS